MEEKNNQPGSQNFQTFHTPLDNRVINNKKIIYALRAPGG
jgi:hypothetical protein